MEYSQGIINGSFLFSQPTSSDKDIDYFLQTFKIFLERCQESYLNTKEQIMGLQYRFKHYTQQDYEKENVNKINFILQKWEAWWIKTQQLIKAIKSQRQLFTKKREYGYIGLNFPEIQQKDLDDQYFTQLYQFEVNSAEKNKIGQEIESLRKELVRGVGNTSNSQSHQSLLRHSAMNILGDMPLLGGTELTPYEKLVNVNLMNDSYKKYNGIQSSKYHETLEKTFADVRSQKNYTQLTAARNLFAPQNSMYLREGVSELEHSLRRPVDINRQQDLTHENIFNSKSIDERLKGLDNEIAKDLERRTIDCVLENAVTFVKEQGTKEDETKIDQMLKVFNDKQFEIESQSRLIQADQKEKAIKADVEKKKKENEAYDKKFKEKSDKLDKEKKLAVKDKRSVSKGVAEKKPSSRSTSKNAVVKKPVVKKVAEKKPVAKKVAEKKPSSRSTSKKVVEKKPVVKKPVKKKK